MCAKAPKKVTNVQDPVYMSPQGPLVVVKGPGPDFITINEPVRGAGVCHSRRRYFMRCHGRARA